MKNGIHLKVRVMMQDYNHCRRDHEILRQHYYHYAIPTPERITFTTCEGTHSYIKLLYYFNTFPLKPGRCRPIVVYFNFLLQFCHFFGKYLNESGREYSLE